MKNKINTARHILFWSWNIIFIVFVNLGLMPIIGSDIMYGLRMGSINKDFVAFFAVVLIVPAISALLGFIYLRKDSKKLFELMYCIELPLLALTLFRIFFLRDLTGGVGFFLALFGLSSFYFAYRLFFMKRVNSFQNLSGATMFLWCGAWIFLMLSFLIPPMANGTFEGSKALLIGLSKLTFAELFSTMFGFFFVLIGAVFFIYTSTLFVLFPIIYIYSSFKNWQTTASHLFAVHKQKAVTVIAGTTIAITTIFIASTQQNHESVLNKLKSLSGTDAEKIEIGTNEKHYRKALTDIYLAPYRYMGDYSKSNFIQDIYKRNFNADYESTRWVQVLFNNIARPFIYRGSSNGMAEDQILAERFYGDLFDASIQEDERESIRYAVQSTYSREQIDAGLININEKRVHLDRQELSIKENGEWADVELHEVYYNSSFRPEEIFLHLKLPPGAVINGVWLSDDETKKFAATVAPRGAAQKVYKEIVKRGADPALVEQVGPQLYRLRVFPIPPNDTRYREKQFMHMWLSLRLLKQKDMSWELPVLTEKRNLYWDGNTKFVLNGFEVEKGKDWLPSEVPAKQSSTPLHLSFTMNNQTIEMRPYDKNSIATRCSLAVIVDASLSMRTRIPEILKAKESIDKSCGGQGVEYFTWKNGPQKIEGDFKKAIEEQVFWGVFDSGDLTKNSLSSENNKKAAVVITDRTFFRENEKVSDYTALDKPTWFLLLDRQYARSVNDSLLKRLYEVGGGIEMDWENILTAYTRHEYKISQKDVVDIDARYVWKISKARKLNKVPEIVEPLPAHKLILHAVERGATKDEQELDQLQKIAVRSNIISPYSSMIVLVDDAQRKMLEDAAKEKDRFNRQVETGKELLTSPKAPFETTAVPEPEEWALIIAVFGFLLLHIHRKGYNFRRLYGTMYH